MVIVSPAAKECTVCCVYDLYDVYNNASKAIPDVNFDAQ